jgi:hypothetical protein
VCVHKRSVSLSCSIVFVAGLDMIAKGLSFCGSGPKWSRQQKVCPFVEIHRFRRWFQCLQEMPTGKVCPFVCVHKRSVSLSRSIVLIAGFSTSRRGLSVCGSGPKWSRQQKVCPFVEIHRFRRWFQCLQERSARLCDRFRHLDSQKSICKRSVLLSISVVLVVGFGDYMKGLSFCRAFCRARSFLSLV